MRTHVVERDSNLTTVTLATNCIVCDTEHKVVVDSMAWARYVKRNYGFIQDLFPNLTAGERELFFMTGYCDPCFDEVVMAFEEE